MITPPDNDDTSFPGRVSAPLWLVLILASGGAGWWVRPVADPEYVTKSQMLEKLDAAMAPVIEAMYEHGRRSDSNLYRIDQLEKKVDRLERLHENRK